MLSRKKARENAFILIFEKSFNNSTLEEILETAKQVRDFETDEFSEKLFFGVYENIDLIDNLIRENLKGWKLERISKIALSLIRMAIYEIIKMPDVPVSVSINEAVVLCKNYATDEDAAYLNGILGSVARSIEKEEE